MIRIFIVDDEPNAVELLKETFGIVADDVEVVGSAGSVEEAKQKLPETDIDLLFLDISLGRFTGFDLLLSLGMERDFEVIICSAHDDRTMKAIRNGVFDYIVKPIDPDEIVRCMERFRQHKKSTTTGKSTSLKRIAIPGKSGIEFFVPSDILYIKAERNYSLVRLVTGEERLVSKHLKYVEGQLHHSSIFRCHRSYLVNLEHVVGLDKSDGGLLYLQGKERCAVPIGDSSRKALYALLDDGIDYL